MKQLLRIIFIGFSTSKRGIVLGEKKKLTNAVTTLKKWVAEWESK